MCGFEENCKNICPLGKGCNKQKIASEKNCENQNEPVILIQQSGIFDLLKSGINVDRIYTIPAQS